MKAFYYFLVFFFALQFANAQTTINATVQDESNKLLHYVIIEDNKYGNVAFTDSVGSFTMKVHPDSKLTFESTGFRDTVISGDKITADAQIILKPTFEIPVEAERLNGHPVIMQNGLLAMPTTRTNVVGIRYLSGTFVHGFFNIKDGSHVYRTDYLYNYDKVSGSILLCVNNNSLFELSDDRITSFSFVNDNDQRSDFERVPEIPHSHFVQLLSTGTKYKIYKRIKTRFVAAEFSNVAMGQIAGHDYDEYVDETQYYALEVESNKIQEFSAKKSSIRTIFAKDNEKVNEFISKNTNADDDEYIVNLGNYLNK